MHSLSPLTDQKPKHRYKCYEDETEIYNKSIIKQKRKESVTTTTLCIPLTIPITGIFFFLRKQVISGKETPRSQGYSKILFKY